MAQTFLFLGAHCYGGVASTAFARSLLALEAACVGRKIRLRSELGAGEALISRARAGVLAQFLNSEATHLMIVDGDAAFDAEAVLAAVDSGAEVTAGPGKLVLTRAAAERVAAAHPELMASMRDLRGASREPIAMVFDGMVEPGSGRYLADLDAFRRRWTDLGGEVRAWR